MHNKTSLAFSPHYTNPFVYNKPRFTRHKNKVLDFLSYIRYTIFNELNKTRSRTMTKSQIFKQAHKIAKSTVAKVGDYMIALSLALKEVYKMSKKTIIDQVKELSGVYSLNQWKDRVYVNLKGNGRNFRGERTAKIYIKDDKLSVELGKGFCSSEWHENLEQLEAIFN